MKCRFEPDVFWTATATFRQVSKKEKCLVLDRMTSHNFGQSAYVLCF